MRRPKSEASAPQRRRCRNCGMAFYPRVPHQDFCADNCRKAFHKAGGVSFKRIQYVIQQEVRRQLSKMKAEFARLVALAPAEHQEPGA
jgi:protein-arginine kinase activator protein McsA